MNSEFYEEYEGIDVDKYDGLIYLNVYLVDQAYGGPEEGGWWYNIGECLASIPFETLEEITEEIKDKYQKMFEKIYYREPHKDRFQTNGEADVIIIVENYKGSNFPQTCPHYE